MDSLQLPRENEQTVMFIIGSLSTVWHFSRGHGIHQLDIMKPQGSFKSFKYDLFGFRLFLWAALSQFTFLTSTFYTVLCRRWMD
jgi:hypothetical protein